MYGNVTHIPQILFLLRDDNLPQRLLKMSRIKGPTKTQLHLKENSQPTAAISSCVTSSSAHSIHGGFVDRGCHGTRADSQGTSHLSHRGRGGGGVCNTGVAGYDFNQVEKQQPESSQFPASLCSLACLLGLWKLSQCPARGP